MIQCLIQIQSNILRGIKLVSVYKKVEWYSLILSVRWLKKLLLLYPQKIVERLKNMAMSDPNLAKSKNLQKKTFFHKN